MKIIAGIGATAFTAGALYWHGDLSGGQLYDVPTSQLYREIGDMHPHEKIAPMIDGTTGGMTVDVVDEPAMPGLRWHYRHGEDDIGSVVAKLSASGANRTRVNISYEAGSTDEAKWRTKDARQFLKAVVQPVMAEQIKARIEKREVDQSVISNAMVGMIVANPGGIQREAISRMDEAAADFKRADVEEAERKKEQAFRDAQKNAGKPATDLSRYR
jgi:hypothetical protein